MCPEIAYTRSPNCGVVTMVALHLTSAGPHDTVVQTGSIVVKEQVLTGVDAKFVIESTNITEGIHVCYCTLVDPLDRRSVFSKTRHL